MVHKPNRHSHKDACHNSDKHIPEELLHGDILLPKDVPHGPHLRPFAPGRQADLCPKLQRCWALFGPKTAIPSPQSGAAWCARKRASGGLGPKLNQSKALFGST